MEIGSCQVHPSTARTSGRSRPPTHRAARFALKRFDAAHCRNVWNPPTAREHTKSSGASSSPNSSYRLIRTRAFTTSISRMTSARKVPFFAFDSTTKISSSGAKILIGNPGKPAPEPMSASRPFRKGMVGTAYIDSQKCRYKISVDRGQIHLLVPGQ
jgi:hypothetical protein